MVISTSSDQARSSPMYKLFQWQDSKPMVAVVGCGGTGAFVAEGLCRFLSDATRIVLIDHDRVEERNLGRQNFYRRELGQFKSEALARRLSDNSHRPIGYSTLPVSTFALYPDIIVGCVDNGRARQDIADMIVAKHQGQDFFAGWWIDAGNGENYGQVLIGNRPLDCIDHQAFDEDMERCFSLPLPTIQRPDLLLELPPVPNCAEAVAQDGQSPTINQCMAAVTLEAIRRTLAGDCSWMQLYIDMNDGRVTPTLATPETVAKIANMHANELVSNQEKKERR